MFAACILSISLMGGVTAQEQSQGLGILVMAHGGDAAWNEAVEAVVKPLREEYPTEIAFGMARSSTIKAAVERLEARGATRIAVVRMFISGDSFLQQTEYILGLTDTLPPAAHQPHHPQANASHHSPSDTSLHSPSAAGLHSLSAVGHSMHLMEAPVPIESTASFFLSRLGVADSPLVDKILIDRVKALSKDPSRESVLLLAHGPADEAENERWLADMRLRVQGLHELGAFKHIQCETLREDWPKRRAEAERRLRQYVIGATENGDRCLVIPFRVAGFGPYRNVLHGLNYIADERGFCPHPLMTQWLEQAAHRCWSQADADAN